jgi:stress-induced morphogen
MMTNELTCCHCISPYFLSLGAFDDPNGSHISIVVVSDKFEGKRAVQRQQMVYKAIWEELAGPVHAVDSMICKTPTEE